MMLTSTGTMSLHVSAPVDWDELTLVVLVCSLFANLIHACTPMAYCTRTIPRKCPLTLEHCQEQQHTRVHQDSQLPHNSASAQGSINASHAQSLTRLTSLSRLKALSLGSNEESYLPRLGLHCLPSGLTALTLQVRKKVANSLNCGHLAFQTDT